MKITKDKDNLIISIPLYQTGEYTYGEGKWRETNFVLVRTWDKRLDGWDYTISKAIYLDYKDDIQEGMPIVHLSKGMFEAIQELGFPVFTEHPPCSKCKEPIYGSFTWDDGGAVCFACEKNA